MAIQRGLSTSKRFVAHDMPTGGGKSLIALGEAAMSNKRTLILTASNSLLNQYMDEASEMGALKIWGKANHTCIASLPGGEHYDGEVVSVDDAPCQYGAECSLKNAGCTYYDDLRRARLARLVITNYSMWLACNSAGEAMGRFPLIVCDEAHEADEQVSKALTVTLTPWMLKLAGLKRKDYPHGLHDWINWCRHAKDRLSVRISRERASRSRLPHLRSLLSCERELARVARIEGDEAGWLPIHGVDGEAVQFTPIWGGKGGSESLLFGRADSVRFVSATLRPKSLHLLGLSEDSFDFFSYGSTFPSQRRPIYYLPSVRMRYGMSDDDESAWIRKVGELAKARPELRGLIHTVSFARQQRFVDNVPVDVRNRLIVHNRGDRADDTIRRFKEAPPDSILVGPSFDTGVDLPGDWCRFVVIPKIPFPDASDPVLVARSADDPDYAIYLAAKTLVQMAGRGMRSAEDWCETFITDSTFGMFYYKRDLLPDWFWHAVRWVTTIPNNTVGDI